LLNLFFDFPEFLLCFTVLFVVDELFGFVEFLEDVFGVVEFEVSRLFLELCLKP